MVFTESGQQPTSAYGSTTISNVDLLPSSHSTDLSSLENLIGVANKSDYQAAPIGDVEEDPESSRLLYQNQRTSNSSSEIQLNNFGHLENGKSEDTFYGQVAGRKVRVRNLLILGVVAVVVGLIVVASKRGSSIHVPFSHDNNNINKELESTLAFSTLDPVSDLGLPKFHRPATSKPPPPLKHGQPDAKHYPTNAWYQNLLMPFDEPGENHRAYAIPSVVDCVGPVPGLRVHPNHVDASSFVVQVNVITEYGLTIGATVDARESTGTSHHATHMYKATHTTPLGVTLDFVS